MKPLGIQLIAEFIYCSWNMLNDHKALERVIRQGVKECGLTIVKMGSKKFNPVGVTAFAIIGESHISIHTYPEAGHASIDIFTCTGTAEAPKKLLNFFKKKFKPKSTRSFMVQRGNPMDIIDKNWIDSFASYGFEVRYRIQKKLLSTKSKFQQIDIIENDDFGRILFLDKDIQVSEHDAEIYDKALVDPIVKEKKKLGKVAVLGGGDGGVLHELLKYNPKEAYLIDIDKEVIRFAKKYLKKICFNAFEDPRSRIIYDDANQYLKTMKNFDAIVYDLTMHPEAIIHVDRTIFLTQMFKGIRGALKTNGIFTAQCCSEFDKETTKLVKRLLSKGFKDIQFTKVFVPCFCEYWVFVSAKAKQILPAHSLPPTRSDRRPREKAYELTF